MYHIYYCLKPLNTFNTFYLFQRTSCCLVWTWPYASALITLQGRHPASQARRKWLRLVEFFCKPSSTISLLERYATRRALYFKRHWFRPNYHPIHVARYHPVSYILPVALYECVCLIWCRNVYHLNLHVFREALINTSENVGGLLLILHPQLRETLNHAFLPHLLF